MLTRTLPLLTSPLLLSSPRLSLLLIIIIIIVSVGIIIIIVIVIVVIVMLTKNLPTEDCRERWMSMSADSNEESSPSASSLV